MKQKDSPNILKCDSAVSEIIGAIMFLAIVVSVIALIQTQSVPEWNKAVELDHYNVVYDDFLKIRSDIEDVALFQFPKSSVIHMGAHYPDRLIFINPVGTSGTMTSDRVWINVSYINSTGNAISENFSSTSIRFEPNYNFYSNAASLVYEHGLVIKDFSVNNYLYTDADQAIISDNTINVLSLDYPLESMSFSDIKTMNYNPGSKENIGNNTNVTVTLYTNYPMLWKELFKKYNFTYYFVSDNNTLKFDFRGNISINAYTIDGSIASGTGISITPTFTATPPTPTPTSTPTPAPSKWTYVSNIFDLLNITGTVTDFPAARNASDGGKSAVFVESLTGVTSQQNNYTNVTGYTFATGMVTNFSNMQTALDGGAFANLTEGISLGGVWINTSYYSNYAVTGQHSIEGAPDNSLSYVTTGRIQGTTFASGASGTITKVVLKYYYRISNYDSNDIPTAGYTLNDVETTVRTDTNNVAYNYPNPTYTLDITSALGTWTWADIQSINMWLNVARTGDAKTRAYADAFEVNVSTINATYNMNITTNTTSVPKYTNYYLEMNYKCDAGETGYGVYVFNGTGWTLKGSLTSNVWLLANFTLSSTEVLSGVRVRYIDQTPAGINQGNLSIDYQRIHGYTPGILGSYTLNVTTNTTDIPEATDHILQLRYNVSLDNFTLQLWNGSFWNNRTILNNTSLSNRNITLLHDELIFDGTAGGINKYYILVRYLDLNTSTTQQGRLYLDYQRIYNI